MTSQPLVSVTIPYFNGQDYIQAALESALKQTYSNLEVILVDDGSSDSAATEYLEDLVQKLADPRIRYFYKKNEGLSATRNFAIERAHGELVALLDQDDLWEPTKIEKQVIKMEDPEVTLVYTDTLVFSDDPNQGRRVSAASRPREGDCFSVLLRENFITCSSVLMRRRDLIEIGPFNRKFRYAEEYDFFLRLAARHKFAYVGEVLTKYRSHGRNTTAALGLNAIYEVLDVLDQFPSNSAQGKNVKRAKADLYYSMVKGLIKQRGFRRIFPALVNLVACVDFYFVSCVLRDLGRCLKSRLKK